jgi:uncharacterized membrane protein YhhN
MSWILLTVGALGVALAAEKAQLRWLLWMAKPTASAGFLFLAVAHGALGTPYGQAIFVALVLSWIGDVALIARGRLAFLAGLGAFLLGHVGFGVAFWIRGVDLLWAGGALVVASAIALVVARWLLPNVPAALKAPVVAYIVVITGMVALAMGTHGYDAYPFLVLAAWCFFASDLAVARQRFIEATISNKLWGLPLYYLAQLLFATTV